VKFQNIIIRIAVLMTCHNRRETTLSCLDALYQQKLPENITFEVYLVDDGSTDGTSSAVRQRFSSVNIIEGSGNLYWCGGMRLAWKEAMKKNHDFYLWLNDDTLLFSDAIDNLLNVIFMGNVSRFIQTGIVVGSTKDPVTAAHTYGGCKQIQKNSFDFRPVLPNESFQPCDTFNGNCVLVSQVAFSKLGNLSSAYTHAIGDTDYGLRAKKSNIPIWVAPYYAGTCKNNPTPSWADHTKPLSNRLRHLQGPKGLPPGEWLVFCIRHAGWTWPLKVIKLYLRVLSPNLWNKIKMLPNDIQTRFDKISKK